MTNNASTVVVVSLAVFLLAALIWANLREYYGWSLDEIYDQEGRRLLILWYNKFSEDKVERNYKVLMKL